MMSDTKFSPSLCAETSPKILSRLFQDILGNIPALVTVFDHQFSLVYTNQNDLLDESDEQQRNYQALYRAFYAQGANNRQYETLVAEVFETGKACRAEHCLPGFGHFEIHSFPLSTNQQQVEFVGQYLRNIDEKRRVEEALSGANQKLEAIIEASPLAIIALDHDVNLTLWNPAAEHMFGWQKEEVLGKPYPIVNQYLKIEVGENIQRLQKGETRRSVETQRMHKTGALIDVSLSTAPMCDRHGTTIGYMAIIADIRERKRAQEALRQSGANYRTIFDAANDATFVFDPENGTMLDVNRKMCEMYGYEREQVLQLNVGTLCAGFPPYTYEDLLRKIWKTRYDSSHIFEWLAKDRSARLFWIEVTMKGATIGGEYRVLAVVRDISERKRAEEENKKMQERLRQIDKMAAIGTLASGIAHEINNPNNFILANAQIINSIWPEIDRILSYYALRSGPFFLGRLPFSEASSSIPKMLGGLIEGANRINTIVTGLKNFARQEKSQLNQVVDVNRVIQAALPMLKNQIRKHTDTFDCFLADSLPSVKGSFQQLEQVVVNLTMNALHALEERESGVYLFTAYDKKNEHVVITVCDEGAGMAEELRQVIFDPFFTTKHDCGGTGLGLSICYSIIKEHGGLIDCDSAPGQGSTFTVRLPLCPFEHEAV
ncbi:MAG: PAS domain S-box protein [Desulfobulbus sp.]|nr:PAS domain S-box protein [Desulfobulbus sp.]